jgi:hypothetical protein
MDSIVTLIGILFCIIILNYYTKAKLKEINAIIGDDNLKNKLKNKLKKNIIIFSIVYITILFFQYYVKLFKN